MLNPANEAKMHARIQDLFYWEYMEKTFPGCVQKFVWGVKKETRKEKRESMSGLEKMLDRSNYPGMKLLSHTRNLAGKRSTYR
jgi:hypothetical protein